MKLKLHPYKIANLVIIYFLFFGVIIYTIFNNDFKQSQSELRNFYNAQLDRCSIITIKEKSSHHKRGTYKVFTTDCSIDYYPVNAEPYDNRTFQKELDIIKTS